jgi:hypothetical protein
MWSAQRLWRRLPSGPHRAPGAVPCSVTSTSKGPAADMRARPAGTSQRYEPGSLPSRPGPQRLQTIGRIPRRHYGVDGGVSGVVTGVDGQGQGGGSQRGCGSVGERLAVADPPPGHWRPPALAGCAGRRSAATAGSGRRAFRRTPHLPRRVRRPARRPGPRAVQGAQNSLFRTVHESSRTLAIVTQIGYACGCYRPVAHSLRSVSAPRAPSSPGPSSWSPSSNVPQPPGSILASCKRSWPRCPSRTNSLGWSPGAALTTKQPPRL